MSFFLTLYRVENDWFFDDKNKNIYKEQFVNGMPDIIEKVYPRYDKVCIEVSDIPIFEADVILSNIKDPIFPDELYYKYESLVGWLCPVFTQYFDSTVPPFLWVKRV